ncbi:uncharacterized protein BDR25DRAFT_124039 [Lindgomyces ingoldianus]|uniref:Uncharacterized protein n=1 Tax=Lindgomyces ingoldianus TaxID=673940 RepID=A0ACB6R342_9PLEO|nr:uncharacterized protein BDR25DRAFT_124039 [Lindgomyces ingoldianus]KAF2473596.1 hypothetical protein BDR25DRAFT_124039 [Lindgomyces ingoldianus]
MSRCGTRAAAKCLQTIEVEKILYSISFYPSNNYLHTDVGVINISTLPISTPALTSAETQIA